MTIRSNRVFSHDITPWPATGVSQDNETAAMFVYQTNPLGVELFSFVNALLHSNTFAWLVATRVKTLYRSSEVYFFIDLLLIFP